MDEIKEAEILRNYPKLSVVHLGFEIRWSGSRVLVHNCPRPLLLSAVIYLFIVFVYATFHPLPNTHLTFWKSEEGCTLCDLKA